MRLDLLLKWLATGAALAVSAHGEWALAVTCGHQPLVAAGLPVALDAYAVRAMKAGREVLPPVLGMIASNAAADLLAAGKITVTWPLVVAVSAIAPLVLWRLHSLRQAAPVAAEADLEDLPYPKQEPSGYGVPEDPAPVPAAMPAGPVCMLEVRPLPPALEAARRRPVLAEDGPRTRAEVHAEYVPDGTEYAKYTGPDQQQEQDGEDELTERARDRFAAVLAEGGVPSIRTLRAEYGIGQPRAQRVQDALRRSLQPTS